jgi:hypothetical protein
MEGVKEIDAFYSFVLGENIKSQPIELKALDCFQIAFYPSGYL